MGEITIHTFGDSHSGFHECGWNGIFIDGITIHSHWIGPVTCASFGVRRLEIINIAKFNVKNGDVVCFSFGEIDIRAKMHIIHNEWKGFVDSCVVRYFEAIRDNVSQFKNLKVLVSCIPPVAQGANDPMYPTLGTDDERKEYTEYMNLKFREECKKYGYIFYDFYKSYCNEEGFLNESMGDGHVHIKDVGYMKDELLKILGI